MDDADEPSDYMSLDIDIPSYDHSGTTTDQLAAGQAGKVNPYGSNFITLDQIMGMLGSGGRGSGGGRNNSGWESDVSSHGGAGTPPRTYPLTCTPSITHTLITHSQTTSSHTVTPIHNLSFNTPFYAPLQHAFVTHFLTRSFLLDYPEGTVSLTRKKQKGKRGGVVGVAGEGEMDTVEGDAEREVSE